MLVLTRRIHEVIVIGDGAIEIIVLGVKGTLVRLGINAPSNVEIWRQEVYERRKAERASGGPLVPARSTHPAHLAFDLTKKDPYDPLSGPALILPNRPQSPSESLLAQREEVQADLERMAGFPLQSDKAGV